MGQQGEGHLQAGGQQGGVQAVGPPQEQAGHELRDDGPSPEVKDQLENSTHACLFLQVLLPARHPGKGGRSEARLPVRGRAQDRRHRGGGLQQHLRN